MGNKLGKKSARAAGPSQSAPSKAPSDPGSAAAAATAQSVGTTKAAPVLAALPAPGVLDPAETLSSIVARVAPIHQAVVPSIDLPVRKPSSWVTVRFFISSTFRDQGNERTVLLNMVFPRLAAELASSRVRCFAIDLRWGVTKAEADNNKVVEICLREMQKCRPFFIFLIGDRYGWCPDVYSVPDAREFSWVKHIPPGHSVTALEVLHGLLLSQNQQKSEKSVTSFAYFRDSSFIEQVPEKARGDFQETAAVQLAKLEELKAAVNAVCQASTYKTKFLEIVDDTPKLDMTEFSELVHRDMLALMTKLYPPIMEDSLLSTHSLADREAAMLDARRQVHADFISTRCRHFFGRQSILDSMYKFLEQKKTESPLLILGEPGSGKSTLLARFYELNLLGNAAAAASIYHFIGCGPGTSNILVLLERICKELKYLFDLGKNTESTQQEVKVLGKSKFQEGQDITYNWRGTDMTRTALKVFRDLAYFIRYVEYDSTWDEWVPSNRLCPQKAAQPGGDFEIGQDVYFLTGQSMFFRGNILEILPNGAGFRASAVIGGEYTLQADKIWRTVPSEYQKGDFCMLSWQGGFYPIQIANISEEETWFYKFNSQHDFAAEFFPEESLLGGVYSPPKDETSESDILRGQLPQDYKGLSVALRVFLEKASEKIESGEVAWKKIVLVVDALNQLDHDGNNAHSLSWLPTEIPKNVFVVTSTLRGEAWSSIQARYRLTEKSSSVVVVGALDQKDREQIVAETLYESSKKLDSVQMNLLLQKKQAALPLYLATACEELRVFGVFERVSEKIMQFPDSVAGLFASVLQRLEEDHTSELVLRTLSLVACSRNGLREEELLSLLGNIQVNPKTSLKFYEKYPHARWLTLFSHLGAYMRAPSDTSTLDFFHRQLATAVRTRYLTVCDSGASPCSIFVLGDTCDHLKTAAARVNPEKWKQKDGKWHQELARCMRIDADPQQDETWQGLSARSFAELPYHQLHAGLWDIKSSDSIGLNLTSTLGNINFLQRACALGLIRSLLEVYQAVSELEVARGSSFVAHDSVREWRQLISKKAHVLEQYPNLLFQLAYNWPTEKIPAIQAHQDGVREKVEKTQKVKQQTILWENRPDKLDPCAITMYGHAGGINACCFCPTDPTIVASASTDGTIRVWNCVTGTESVLISAHEGWVTCMAFSPNGKYLASGSFDMKVKVWDWHTGTPLAEFVGHGYLVCCIEWSSDSESVWSASEDHSIRRWDVKAAVSAKTVVPISSMSCVNYQVHNGMVSTISVKRPTDSIILSGSGEDKQVKIWKVVDRTLECLQVLAVHTAGIRCVTWDPSFTFFVSCAYDCKLFAFVSDPENTGMFKVRDAIERHTAPVKWCSFRTPSVESTQPDPRIPRNLLVSASDDNSLMVWDCEKDWKLIGLLRGHSDRINSCHVSSDGKRVLSGSDDLSVKLWEWLECPFAADPPHKAPVCALSVSPDAKRLATASEDRIIKIWDTATHEQVGVLKGHTGYVNDCVFATNTQLVTASQDKTIRVWNVASGDQLSVLRGHTKVVTEVCVNPSKPTVVASSSHDRSVILWDLETGSQLCSQQNAHENWVLSVDFSHTGNQLATCSRDKSAKVWAPSADFRSLALLRSIVVGAAVNSVIFSGASTIATAGRSAMLQTWNIDSGTCLQTMAGHTKSLTHAATTSGHLASASEDKTVRLWTEAAELDGVIPFDDAVRCVVFLPNKHIAAGSNSGDLLWLAY
eukprot:TRINITY_DN1020_c0_g1_i4.p1 TRINITY_DN1020_c0_g1~~TRINITY_DN1020_c0_g1_i4.p1  ORF type:complete len:1726 (-),score=374.09 TRINITY_DN1020_c0_g1_i4:2054-7231(-)